MKSTTTRPFLSERRGNPAAGEGTVCTTALPDAAPEPSSSAASAHAPSSHKHPDSSLCPRSEKPLGTGHSFSEHR